MHRSSMTAFWGTNCTLPLPPLFLAKALDGASLPTLGAAQLVECGVRVEHAPGLAAFLVTLCENSAV